MAETPTGGWFETGDPLSLRVRILGGIPPVLYQWLKDGLDIPGEDSDSYTVDALTAADTGWYACRVTDGSKGVMLTEPVLVQVFDSLPANTVLGAGLIVLAIVLVSTAGWIWQRSRRKAND